MAKKKVLLRVLTPVKPEDGTDGEGGKIGRLEKAADMVIMRCINGDWGVLPGHEARMAVLGDGVLRMLNDDGEEHVLVHGGLAEVRDASGEESAATVLTILTEGAELVGIGR